MNAKELAKKYYPVYWDINRVRKLVEIGKLNNKEYKEITGENFGNGKSAT